MMVSWGWILLISSSHMKDSETENSESISLFSFTTVTKNEVSSGEKATVTHFMHAKRLMCHTAEHPPCTFNDEEAFFSPRF